MNRSHLIENARRAANQLRWGGVGETARMPTGAEKDAADIIVKLADALEASTPPDAAGDRGGDAGLDWPSLWSTLAMCERDQGHNPGMMSISVENMRAIMVLAARSAATASPAEVGLREVLARLLEACGSADADEELPGHIDGSLLDAARLALDGANTMSAWQVRAILAEQRLSVIANAFLPSGGLDVNDWADQARAALAKPDAQASEGEG